jgi:ribosomal protein L12E/L44/L45/RPP1/RPP2
MAGRKQGPGGRRTIKDRISRPRASDRAVLAEVAAEVAPEAVESVAAALEAKVAPEVVESAAATLEEAAPVPVEERPASADDSNESSG